MARARSHCRGGPARRLAERGGGRSGREPRVAFIEKLIAAGLTSIEAGSFVSPKWVPQMADTAAVLKAFEGRAGISLPVLVPNEKGLDAALAAGAREIAIFGAASETFSQKNINCSIAESLERFRPVAKRALAAGVRVRGYVSCVLGCPYEGQRAARQGGGGVGAAVRAWLL